MHTTYTSRRHLPLGTTREGTLLLEAIIAISVFAIFLGGIGLSLILGERSTLVGGDRTRAVFLAEQQLEGVRQMRDNNYSSITVGHYGVDVEPSGWVFSGSYIVNDGYNLSVDITDETTDTLKVVSNVSWNFGNTRSGSLALSTYIANWRNVTAIGNWSTMTNAATLASGSTPEYQKVVIAGDYAFVSSSQASGGNGLYVFDISDPANPLPVSTAFNLGASAYGMAVTDNRLVLATDNPTAEVQVYDISDPTNLTASNLVNSYDLPGSRVARSVAVYENTAFVGTTDNAVDPQFYSLAMSDTGPMTMLDSLGMTGSVVDMALKDGYAYIANSNNAAELLVADLVSPTALKFATGNGVDMTGSEDAFSVAISGTSALVGRSQGGTIEEVTLYDVKNSPVPTPPPSWTLEVDGDVNHIATIPGSAYAFIANNKSALQIRVIDLVLFAQGQPPTVQTFDAAAAINGLAYDTSTDRLYAVSPSDFFVFAPGP